MTAIGDLLDEAARRKLQARLEELRALDRLVREPGLNRPPDPPPPLATITTRRTAP
jgi:hypothetical protein